MISKNDKISDILNKYPDLKEKLIARNPRFKRLNNPVLFKVVSKWARLKDVARVGKEDINELLEFVNKAIGETYNPNLDKNVEIEEITEKPQELPEWMLGRNFETLDVRKSLKDPFDEIMAKADSLKIGEGFELIQTFEPKPLLPIIEARGFEHYTVKEKDDEYHVFFYRAKMLEIKLDQVEKCEHDDNPYEENGIKKIDVVLQSATPIAIPIFALMKRSKKLSQYFNFTEIKVWEDTEKHLGWMVSGKADISFSAIIASAKLFATGTDIKLLSVDVWDNFKILSNKYNAKTFEDLKGTKINLPLLKAAPPYAITAYLMEKEGVNPSDFEYEYGIKDKKGFGRPEDIAKALIYEEIETGLLREPDASFALFGNPNVKELFNYGDIWAKHHKDLKNLPNAGVIFKGEIVRKYPEHVKVFMEELKRAIDYTNQKPRKVAGYSYREFNRSIDAVEFFIKRANFKHVKATEIKKELMLYLNYMNELGLIKLKNNNLTEEFIYDYS